MHPRSRRPARGPARTPAPRTRRVDGQRSRQDLTIQLTPTLQDQELDTRPSTGVVYWEGSQVVEATRGGPPVEGEAYVELQRLPDYE